MKSFAIAVAAAVALLLSEGPGVVTAAATPSQEQGSCAQTALAIPACAQSCLLSAGAASGCAATDFSCQCAHRATIASQSSRDG